MDDYRNTKYCKNLSGIDERKKKVEEHVKIDHPRATDMHRYIKDNGEKYKLEFIEAYNGKCAYCGCSMDFITKEQFQIDHFVNIQSFETDAKAGYIENLVLSCYRCNHNKGDFQITDDNKDDLYPDEDGIKTNFCRDNLFNICLSEKGSKKSDVCSFYERLKLGEEVHRLDYLLMSMKGLLNKLNKEGKNYSELSNAILLLQRKRNLM